MNKRKGEMVHSDSFETSRRRILIKGPSISVWDICYSRKGEAEYFYGPLDICRQSCNKDSVVLVRLRREGLCCEVLSTGASDGSQC
jgi:hypothetical protein